MESVLNNLVDNLSPVLSFMLLISIVITYFFKERIYGFLSTGKLSLRSQLKDHDLFTTIDKLLTVDIHEIKFEEDAGTPKDDIFKDFIEIKLLEIKRQAMSTILSKDTLRCSKSEYSASMRTLVTDIVAEYNRKALNTFRLNGLSDEQCSYVLQTFDKWHNDTLRAVYNRINMVLAGDYHKTNYQKTVAILEVFAMAVELTMTDGVRSFEEMNGYFKKVKYKRK